MLSIVDHASIFLQLVALPIKGACIVAEAFRHFVILFGSPRLLQIDIGTEFKNVQISKVSVAKLILIQLFSIHRLIVRLRE